MNIQYNDLISFTLSRVFSKTSLLYSMSVEYLQTKSMFCRMEEIPVAVCFCQAHTAC